LVVEVASVLFERISIDPSICHGQACVKGTRIPVHQIIRMLANGDTPEDLLAEYPSLSREDIMACLALLKYKRQMDEQRQAALRELAEYDQA
jgi:uncharacterized protein (DUF433 family)